jgi:PRTRC genetic system ThiF family protein
MRYEEFVLGHRYAASADVLVSCVDSRSARQVLHQLAWRDANRYGYWLDLGNTESTAQVVLGEPQSSAASWKGQGPRLPCVTELFPELLDAAAPENNQPSCSVRMSLASQGLFVNDVAVRYAAQLLYELFSKGRLSAHGVVVNLESKRSGPIEVDPRTWARFGFSHEDAERQEPELESVAEGCAP